MISRFPPRWSTGGGELQALHLSRHFAKKGLEVHVITKSENLFPYRETIDDVFVHRLLYSHRSIVLRFVYFVLTIFETMKLRPHLIHVICVFPDGFFASLTSIILRRPLIVMSIDSDVRLPNPLVVNLFWKIILRTAQTVIVREGESANRLASYVDSKKIIVMPNGVDASRFQLSRRKCRALLGLSDEEKVVLYVGRLEPVKNVKSLLIAFANILEEFQNARLLLIGSGTEKSQLMEMAARKHIDQRTAFIGEISPDNVPTYMVAADLFVLPSISEGSPNVILEALAAGVPILASKVGGVPDLVRDGRDGFLFDVDNVTQMSNLMTLMLRNSQLRRKMSRAEKNRVCNFSLDEANDKILKICLSTLKK